MGLVVTTPASEEPISVLEAKAFLRIDPSVTEFDDLVSSLVEASTELLQEQIWRQLVTATLTWTLDRFPRSAFEPLWVPRPPLQSVSTIQYIDTAGSLQTWSSAEYKVDVSEEPGRILPAYGYDWPETRAEMEAVTITFVAGYGLAAAVPSRAKVALKQLVMRAFDFREPLTVGQVMEVPGLKHVVNSLKVRHFWSEPGAIGHAHG